MVAMVILGIALSCQQDEGLKPQNQENQNLINGSAMEGMIKLGKKLENPYSVENMKKAWENITSNARINGDELEIKTTHLYIRFKPKTEEELSLLKLDSTLTLFTYPLDYEIAETGDYYHDPEVPFDQPTYQYCAVEVDKNLPEGVEYELLAELFIPDEDSDDNSSARVSSSSYVDELVDEALRITGNLEKEDIDNARVQRSRWRPAGTIRLFDDEFGRFIGLSGVEVRATRWFTTHEGITDANGNYSCNGTSSVMLITVSNGRDMTMI
jgi:hypothetical protein